MDSTTNPAARLEDLPVELLEAICHEVIVLPENADTGRIQHMSPLRLTCRQINRKLYSYFARHTFGSISVDNSHWSFQRLLNLSRDHGLATYVTRLGFFPTEDVDSLKYNELRREVESGELTEQEKQEKVARLRQIDQEQSENSHFESSTTDGIMLAEALKGLPNVEEVFIQETRTGGIDLVVRKGQGSPLPTTTHTFSMVLACLSFAGIQPLGFRTTFPRADPHFDAIDIEALCAPSRVLNTFNKLQVLHIRLQTKSEGYKNPETWTTHLANFLKHTPALEVLLMGILDDVDDTSELFSQVARSIKLDKLKRLWLDGFECTGEDLSLFLQNHENLDALHLENLNVLGSPRFPNVLRGIAEHHKLLNELSLHQISQDHRRLIFKTRGIIESKPSGNVQRGTDFFEDFEWVNLPLRHEAIAQDWEGVAEKTRLLADDLAVTERQMHPRHWFERVKWVDQDGEWWSQSLVGTLGV